MPSAAACFSVSFRVAVGILSLLGWLMALGGLAKLHGLCRDNFSSDTCGSGLRSQWWTVALQALVLISLGVLSVGSRVEKWRLPMLGLLVLLSVRLMTEIDIGLDAEADRKFLKDAGLLGGGGEADEEDGFGNDDDYEYEYDSDLGFGLPNELRGIALIEAQLLVSKSRLAKLIPYRDLDMDALRSYVGGLVILTMVNLGLLLLMGTDESLEGLGKWIRRCLLTTSEPSAPQQAPPQAPLEGQKDVNLQIQPAAPIPESKGVQEG